MIPVAGPARDRSTWASPVLRALEWVAYPAMAGLACSIVMLGVITWLPALCATARALRRWREDGDGSVFINVFRSVPRYWRCWRTGATLSGLAGVLLVCNSVFLVRQGSLPALALMVVQLFLLVALWNFLTWLAVYTCREESPTPRSSLRRIAFAAAFGRPSGWLPVIVGVTVLVVLLPTAIGSLAYAPSLCLLIAQTLITHHQGESRS